MFECSAMFVICREVHTVCTQGALVNFSTWFFMLLLLMFSQSSGVSECLLTASEWKVCYLVGEHVVSQLASVCKMFVTVWALMFGCWMLDVLPSDGPEVQFLRCTLHCS